MSLGRKLRLVYGLVPVSLIATALAGCGGGGTSSTTPPPPPATLTLSVSPASLTISANDAFFVTVTATTTGTSATPTITLGALPAGMTTTSTFPMSVPSGGATISFTTNNSLAVGTDTVSVSGSAGSATATGSIPLKVVSGSPVLVGFGSSIFNEVEVAQGGSTSIQGSFISTDANSPIYSATLSVTGLPSGVTAVVSPQLVEPNLNTVITVTLSATSTAPIEQNAEWSVVATPTDGVAATTSANYLVDVTPATGGAGWSNQTSYVSTRASPYSAVYDPAHQLIYSANPTWGRIDVISDATRSIIKSLAIQDSRGMDISTDGSTVWVATGSQVIYGIDTTTFQATQYILPRYGVTSTSAGISWEGAQIFSLDDGTLLLIFAGVTGDGSQYSVFWNPATNSFKQAGNPANWGAVARSGDGKHVFSFGGDEDETSFTYDVLTHTFSNATQLSDFGYASLAASNQDGSEAAVATFGTNGFALYDSNLNQIGPLPGDGGLSGAGVFPIENVFGGGFLFSADGGTIYEETESTATPAIISIDVATQQVKSLAPGMPVIPTADELNPSFYMPAPFGIDAAGMLLGVEYHGIAFDDATVNMNYSPLDGGGPTFMQHMSVYSGPLAGGTTSNGFGNVFSIVPDVYYGAAKGTATLSSNNLEITSPPVTAAGPVDVKMLFPDGSEVFNPQFFTFGTAIKDAIISGGSPQGGAAGTLDAFGLPLDPSLDTVTIGGNKATVTSTVTQYPPFTGEQTDMFLSYTLPSGSPGWADLTVTTPNGTSTLAKSFFFAKSVNDYSTSDSPTFILCDKTRNQVYLSAGDHIDVFSLATNSFSSPLQPPATGASKQFQGLALTPDGKYLLATDLTDNSLAVIDPDSPSNAYAIPIPVGAGIGFSCPTGPLFVAADNLGNAYVAAGGVIGTACGPGGYNALVNLASRMASLWIGKNCGVFNFGGYVDSSGDGTLVALTGAAGYGGFEIYNPALGACIPSAAPGQEYGVTVASDGNVLGVVRAFVNPAGNITGRFAFPGVYYSSADSSLYYDADPFGSGALQNPALNDTGSLYYWAYPGYVDIVDVHHGLTALRFGLTETVANTVAPMAIDSSGQHIFLITNQGLTVVDLGNAPLSVGHFSATKTAAGTQVQLRGSGFESGITATLGGISAPVTFTDSETLALTIPAANVGPEDLVLTNPDGTTYTLQNAIDVQ